MAESVKKRSEIEEAYTWKLEDMIESPEKFEELMDGVEERIPEYEAYRGKLGNSAEYLKNYLTYDESVDETLLTALTDILNNSSQIFYSAELPCSIFLCSELIFLHFSHCYGNFRVSHVIISLLTFYSSQSLHHTP